MDSITLDQTAPISTLPRDYLALFERANVENKPVVLLRHNKSVGAIISNKLLKYYSKLKRMYEEERILRLAEEAREEYRSGKMLTSDDGELEDLLKRV